MKLYTWTAEHSLPRMALKGVPERFPFYGNLEQAAELSSMDNDEKGNPYVVLEVNADGLDDIFEVDGEWGWSIVEMASEEAENEAEAEKAAEKIHDRLDNLKDLADMIDVADWVENSETIPPDRVTVLGVAPESLEEGEEIKFKAAPHPLKVFKQPYVTRLLRSIFLPQHKLYGAGPKMGFVSRFLPKQDAPVDDLTPPDTVGGIPLVWAGGKTFRRGVRGAFGDETGNAIGQLIAMRTGQEPGKYVGSGAKGAVYVLGRDRILKVTMDGSEVSSACNLKGVRHPNLSFIHDAFVVTDGRKGVGVIVRDAIDTTLDQFSKKASKELDQIMDKVLESLAEKVNFITRIEDIDPGVLAKEVELMIELLRFEGCEVDEKILLDLADAFRALQHYGILGIDFDSKNIGVIRKPKPRVVVFDYGMTKSPAVEIEIVSLEGSVL